jgi:malate synthase
MAYLDKSGLKVDQLLVDFVEQEAIPGTGIEADRFWSGLAALVRDFSPRNRALLVIRDQLQSQVDDWHRNNGPVARDPAGYETFLRQIGYLVPEPADFTIETTGLDPEISTICGPQLVVPVSNARYALNAANARWGSLYDALYGTDVIPRRASFPLARATIRAAARRSWRGPLSSSTRPSRLPRAAMPTSPPMSWPRRSGIAHSPSTPKAVRRRSRIKPSSSALPATASGPASCSSTMGCTPSW